MYAIYGNIYHQYTLVLLVYIPYMDPMGKDFPLTPEGILVFPISIDTRTGGELSPGETAGLPTLIRACPKNGVENPPLIDMFREKRL